MDGIGSSAGDRARKFTGLLVAHYASVLAYAGRRVGADLAQDVVADTFLAAWRNFDDLPDLRWTAFGPANVSLHRVNIAVTLGDAGTAIDLARTVELAKIDVTERKASFLMDTACAFLQCGRHERAYLALRAAEEVAPEEITGCPAAHRLVRDLMTTAPLSIQRHAEDFARRIGGHRMTQPARVLTVIVCGAGPPPTSASSSSSPRSTAGRSRS